MKNSILVKVVVLTASLPLLAGCIVERQPRRVVVVQEPAPAEEVAVAQPENPPAPQVEMVPVPPGPAYIWVRGCYEWRSGWVWVPGRWLIGPHPHAVWVIGHWERRPHGHVWIESHWR